LKSGEGKEEKQWHGRYAEQHMLRHQITKTSNAISQGINSSDKHGEEGPASHDFEVPSIS
jgi:hypothetical protein